MVLSSFLAISFAHAGTVAMWHGKTLGNVTLTEVGSKFLVRLDDNDDVATVSAELESDAGSESLTLSQTDAWLHGAAAVAALPAAAATLQLTLYDAGSVPLTTFTGSLGVDGAVSLSPAKESKVDVEILGAAVFPASKGWDLGVDLAGADTYDVAYATLTVTDGKTSTRAELDWDGLGAVWEAKLGAAPEGQVDVKLKTYDHRGKKLATEKMQLGTAWSSTTSSLAIDEDPFTTCGLIMDELHNGGTEGFLVVVSDGWTAGDAIPADVDVALSGGETLTIPANSYQVTMEETATIKMDTTLVTTIVATAGGVSILLDLADASTPSCGGGFCTSLIEVDDGIFEVSVTALASSVGALPTEEVVWLTTYDKSGSKLSSEAVEATFGDEVAVVFAVEAGFSADPVGVGLAGKVKLLGAPNRKGKQETLAKGSFYGSITRTAGGTIGLGGGDKDMVSPKGDILIGGEPIDFELTDTDKDGVLTAPPAVLLRVDSNGKGTRDVGTASNGKPTLL